MDLKKINYKNLGPFRFAQLGTKYLLTNEVGDYLFLTPDEFEDFLYGKIQPKSKLYQRLKKKNFLLKEINYNSYIQQYQKKYHYLFQGPSLHIVVLTLRCNHRCLYCQVSPQSLKDKTSDMNLATAKKVVDFIFRSPSRYLGIEFQGGEPLLNWPVLEYIVNYSRALNKIEKRKLILSLMSNFSLLDSKKINFLIDQGVSFCTSLDGPELVHNQNRKLLRGNSYQATLRGLKKVQKAYQGFPSHRRNKINAVMTITAFSLNHPKEIVDDYLKLKFNFLFIRPLSPFGLARATWQKIGYGPDDFVDFYKKALDYVIKLNLKGRKIYERQAAILLTKILGSRDPNYLELRSPCGAGLSQLAYHYNGHIYTCDEGRMLGEMGDDSFSLGNVGNALYQDIIGHPVTKTLCLASCLDGLPKCAHCVWKPYCGVCPILNYTQFNNIFAQLPKSDHCKMISQILEYLFDRLENRQIKEVFKGWLKKTKPRAK